MRNFLFWIFLFYCQGNRGEIEEKPRKSQEQIRNNQKNLINRGPNFLLKHFLLKEIGVEKVSEWVLELVQERKITKIRSKIRK